MNSLTSICLLSFMVFIIAVEGGKKEVISDFLCGDEDTKVDVDSTPEIESGQNPFSSVCDGLHLNIMMDDISDYQIDIFQVINSLQF